MTSVTVFPQIAVVKRGSASRSKSRFATTGCTDNVSPKYLDGVSRPLTKSTKCLSAKMLAILHSTRSRQPRAELSLNVSHNTSPLLQSFRFRVFEPHIGVSAWNLGNHRKADTCAVDAMRRTRSDSSMHMEGEQRKHTHTHTHTHTSR